MARTITPSGRSAPKPRILRPNFALVSNSAVERRNGTTRTPSLASARVSSRACQSYPSTASAMRSPARASPIEGRIEQGRIAAAGVEALAGLQRGDDHFRGAEQQRIDRVEIALELSEQLREKSREVELGNCSARLLASAAGPATMRCTRPA